MSGSKRPPADDGSMPTDLNASGTQTLSERAYAAFENGDLIEARTLFLALVAAAESPDHHYMLGLICKYLRDWPTSLEHNLHSLRLRPDADEASQWNAAIAATALGDWTQARRQWQDCGIPVPEGDGPIDNHFGVASIRLNAWGAGETLFGKRIDPVRARLINVPLPESGYRYGDIILHDGAATGERRFHQSMVPVLNALQRLETSEFRTFALFVTCPARADLDALIEARVPGIGFIEDWTDSIAHYCLRCSYGTPHRHYNENETANGNISNNDLWAEERSVGVAAQSRYSVEKLVAQWKSNGIGRRFDAIESSDREPDAPPAKGIRWWLSPDDDDVHTAVIDD